MKVNYKGFELEAKREKCMAGYFLLYFTIYQDGYEHVCSFEDSNDIVRTKIKDLKTWVDNFLDCLNRKVCYQCESSLIETMNGSLYCDYCDEYYELAK